MISLTPVIRRMWNIAMKKRQRIRETGLQKASLQKCHVDYSSKLYRYHPFNSKNAEQCDEVAGEDSIIRGTNTSFQESHDFSAIFYSSSSGKTIRVVELQRHLFKKFMSCSFAKFA